MIGSLVVILHTDSTGGEVVFRHDGEEQIYDYSAGNRGLECQRRSNEASLRSLSSVRGFKPRIPRSSQHEKEIESVLSPVLVRESVRRELILLLEVGRMHTKALKALELLLIELLDSVVAV